MQLRRQLYPLSSYLIGCKNNITFNVPTFKYLFFFSFRFVFVFFFLFLFCFCFISSTKKPKFTGSPRPYGGPESAGSYAMMYNNMPHSGQTGQTTSDYYSRNTTGKDVTKNHNIHITTQIAFISQI